MSKQQFLKNFISRTYANRHNAGEDVFGMPGMVDHWDWHKGELRQLRNAITELRGQTPPVKDAATFADFRRDNPGCVW